MTNPQEFRRDLKMAYPWLRNVDQFASYALNREVRIEDLKPRELLRVQIEARAAHTPYEQDACDLQGFVIDLMNDAEVEMYGEDLLR